MPAARNRTILAAALGVLALLAAAAARADDCDPMSDLNDKAKSLRADGKLDKAQRIVDKILKARSDDFRANYTAALLQIDASGTDAAKHLAGIKRLEALETTLPQQDPACAKKRNLYGVYNMVGVEYYNIGDLASAERNFERGYANRDKLGDGTNARLFDNMGLVAFKRGDYVCAHALFEKSNGTKRTPETDAHLKLVNTVLSSAKDKRTCDMSRYDNLKP